MKTLTDHIQQLYKAMERSKDNPRFPNAYKLAVRQLTGMQEISRYIYYAYANCGTLQLMHAIGHLPEDVGIEV